MTRPALVRPGLRLKLLLALVATSAVTLAAAMLAIVHPLEQRLEADRLHELHQLARTTRLAVDDLPAGKLRPGSESIDDLAASIERRTGAHASLYDTRGVPLVVTDPQRTHTQDRARLKRVGDVWQGVVDGAAVVETRAQRRNGSLTIVLRKPLRDERAAAAVVRKAVPVAAAAGLAIAVLLAAALSVWLLRRLERLRRAARRLAEGHLAAPLPPDPSRDEVGDLARALEAMRTGLRGAEASRQRFVSTASHELRTPIASLQGTLELLAEELEADDGSPAARERAARALRQSRELARLATDLLHLSRVDAGVELCREPVDLHDTASAIADELEPVAAAAGGAVRVESPPQSGAWALGDPMAVAQIVRLLLDNALRHGRGGDAEVAVRFVVEDGRARLRVADRGPGIAPADRARLFERFERGAGSAGRPGFGLGLPIGRGLARLMGGELRSLDVPVGACLELELPACAAPDGEAAAGRPVSPAAASA